MGILLAIDKRLFMNEKIPCDCPKGGRYEDGSICKRCDGVEWVEKAENKPDWERQFDDKWRREVEKSGLTLVPMTWTQLKMLCKTFTKEAIISNSNQIKQEILYVAQREINKLPTFKGENGRFDIVGGIATNEAMRGQKVEKVDLINRFSVIDVLKKYAKELLE